MAASTPSGLRWSRHIPAWSGRSRVQRSIRCKFSREPRNQGYEIGAWWGFGAPKNTPAEIVEKVNREVNAGLADPKMKARLVDLGGTALPGSPAEFGKLIADETEKWATVIKFAGLKAD
jgi:tripartite-type tricarboxylate transporter receptor subunit TctC